MITEKLLFITKTLWNRGFKRFGGILSIKTQNPLQNKSLTENSTLRKKRKFYPKWPWSFGPIWGVLSFAEILTCIVFARVFWFKLEEIKKAKEAFWQDWRFRVRWGCFIVGFVFSCVFLKEPKQGQNKAMSCDFTGFVFPLLAQKPLLQSLCFRLVLLLLLLLFSSLSNYIFAFSFFFINPCWENIIVFYIFLLYIPFISFLHLCFFLSDKLPWNIPFFKLKSVKVSFFWLPDLALLSAFLWKQNFIAVSENFTKFWKAGHFWQLGSGPIWRLGSGPLWGTKTRASWPELNCQNYYLVQCDVGPIL